jgi:hypothetical protein
MPGHDPERYYHCDCVGEHDAARHYHCDCLSGGYMAPEQNEAEIAALVSRLALAEAVVTAADRYVNAEGAARLEAFAALCDALVAADDETLEVCDASSR